ncbi:MAG: hypothetical protein PHG95_00215 [Patescibacteria group bacterium]|nr:hypothetical protein [Patescibacteria group bacterium]
MKNFRGETRRSGGFGGKRDFGGRASFGKPQRGSFGGHDKERPAMYQAVCSDCGAACEVPFRPTSGKPVFCDSCFRGFDQKRPEAKMPPRDNYREQLSAVHTKLDRIIDILQADDFLTAAAGKIKRFEKAEIAPAVKKLEKAAQSAAEDIESGIKSAKKIVKKVKKEAKATIVKAKKKIK